MMSRSVVEYPSSVFKRLFDISLAILLLVLLSPLLVGVSSLILILMGRPILFKQTRTGKNKVPFQILKFRTMYQNAEKDQTHLKKINEAPWPMFKTNNDPRFVSIGRLLSVTGIDELPQLFNILRGEMSFVGPRPLPSKEAAKLGANWDFRYRMLPGIFSDWSLSDDKYSSLNHWLKLDKKTVTKSSLARDLTLFCLNIVKHIYKLVRTLFHI